VATLLDVSFVDTEKNLPEWNTISKLKSRIDELEDLVTELKIRGIDTFLSLSNF